MEPHYQSLIQTSNRCLLLLGGMPAQGTPKSQLSDRQRLEAYSQFNITLLS